MVITTTTTQISPRKQHSKKIKLVYQSSAPAAASFKAIPHAEIPVFMLPHTITEQIPEDAVISEGFMVNLALPPHRHRLYRGLVSIADPPLEELERTATTAVEFRSFSCERALLA
jgi:hypothetical protein